MIVPYSLLNIFKKADKKEIELYCQNPLCKSPLIKVDEEISNVNGYLSHKNESCEELVAKADAMDYNIPLRSSVITHTSYDKAVKLAREGKVKFSKLEKESTSIGGMGQ